MLNFFRINPKVFLIDDIRNQEIEGFLIFADICDLNIYWITFCLIYKPWSLSLATEDKWKVKMRVAEILFFFKIKNVFLYFYFVHYFRSSHFPPCPCPPPASPTSSWPSPHCCQCPWVMHICSPAHPSPLLHSASPKPPSDIRQPVPCVPASISILFISLFCSLDSTYEWDRMVFVFCQLAYFT